MNIKVVLQENVKNLGKIGDVVRVTSGYARNFLFPRKLALEATERRVKELQHLQKGAEIKKKKALVLAKEVVDKMSKVTVNFKMEAGKEGDKLFGSVTSTDISNELEKQGFSVDRKDIHIETPIKVLGQHKATVKLGEGLEADIKISVERV